MWSGIFFKGHWDAQVLFQHSNNIRKNIMPHFPFEKLQEQECNQRSEHCIPDFKFTLQINLTLLITYLPHFNSAIALFTACASLDYIQGWTVLWIVHCTERHCHTFRWVSLAGPHWLPYLGLDMFSSLSEVLDLNWVGQDILG